MIRVYQTKTIENDREDNAFQACIASLLEIPLRHVNDIVPTSKGNWYQRQKIWLADHGLKLAFDAYSKPPKGYSIAVVYTERCYPEDHPYRPRVQIAHFCVAFNGRIVHDPHPLGSDQIDIRYYNTLVKISDRECEAHHKRSAGGVCIHGYRDECGECPSIFG